MKVGTAVEQSAGREKLRTVLTEEKKKMRNLTKGELWEIVHFMNVVKVHTSVVKLETPITKWERKMLGWLEREWAVPGPKDFWKRKNVTYAGWSPGTKMLYIGETHVGFELRVASTC